jgi:hypothetical protein
MELEDQLPNLEVPEFRFDGPHDLGQMQRIREFISAHIAKQQGIQESVEHNGGCLNNTTSFKKVTNSSKFNC